MVESSHSYDTTIEKKHRPEVSFDLYDDDNGPGSEPSPNDHMCALSLRSRRAAGGLRQLSESPALLAFPTGRLCRPTNRHQSTRRFNLDYASIQRRPEDSKGMYTIAGIQEYVHPPRAGEDRFLRYHLDVETNFGREEGIVGTYTAAQLLLVAALWRV